MGRGGGRGHARAGRGRGRTGRGRLRAAAARDRPGGGDRGRERRWCIRRTARTCSITASSSGGRSRRISPRPSTSSRFRVRWGRSATVPIETFGVAAQWDRGHRDPRRLGLDPDAEVSRPDRARAAPARQRGARALRRRRRRQLRREARHQAHRAGRLSGEEARRAGAPDRGPAREHARRRHARARTASSTCRWRSTATAPSARCKIRALDDVGAYAGRSPLQLGKPVGAIVGPYRIHAIEYEPISVMTNKTPQEAVRGFGQSPTNFALERAIDRVARHLGMDRIELRQQEPHPQGPVSLPDPERHRPTTRGDYHAVLDKALAAIDYPALVAAARRGARAGQLAGIGISTCLEPSGGNSVVRAAVQSEERNHHLDGFVPGARRSVGRDHRRDEHLERRARATRRWSRPCVGEVLERDPAHDPRGARRLAQRAALEQPGRQPHGDHARRRRGRRGAQDQGDAARHRRAQPRMRAGGPRIPRRQRQREGRAATKMLTWDQLVEIAHRKYPPDAAGHGARAAGEVRLGGADRRRAADGRRAHPDVPLLRVRGARRATSRSIRTPAQPTITQVRLRPRLRRDDQSRTSCTA